MKRILVPVDFSTHTKISCRYALQIAQATGAEIILDFYKQKEKKLDELAAELNSRLLEVRNTGVKISTLMESDNPEVQILRAIEQLSPDLIIMGSGGMEILQNFMSLNQVSLITFIPHKRNIFKNLFYQGITREDLFQTRIPIMAVRQVQ